jgi:Antibiotic biosynthesis monooxygenase
MYAILRVNAFDPERLAASADKLQEFDRIHSAQPGFLGTVSVDLEDGRRFLMNIWESAEHARRALPVLAPAVDRLVNPLLSSPSVLVGTGPVVSWPFEGATPTAAGGNQSRR